MREQAVALVRDVPRPDRRGFYGRLTGKSDDPDDDLSRKFVELAAEALLAGVADPVGWLSRGGSDWTVQAAVLHRAVEIRHERRSAELNGLAQAIGGRVAEAISRMFR